MEFGSVNREGFCEEEEDQTGEKFKLLHYSDSSSSSHHHHHHHHHHKYKTQQLAVPLSSNSSGSGSRRERSHNNNNTSHQIYDSQQQMGSSWLGNNNSTCDPTTTTGEEATKQQLDLMETTSSRNDEDVRSASCSVIVEMEHMFDKVVTPSDVGKLNRLVIPKQQAEKYFPLDSATNEKGLLLNFEDRNGKPWRFRYSYWNSSQSYVMTKGWSRFVKDKKLDAGDVVSFQRGVGESGNKDRLFIDWRRRPDAPPDPAAAAASSFPLHHHHHHHHLPFHQSMPWNPLLMRPPILPPMARDEDTQINHFYNRNSYQNGSCYDDNSTLGSVFYLRSSQPPAATSIHPQAQMGMGMVEWQQQQQHQHQQQRQHQQHQIVFDSVPVVQGKAAAKRLRLFGVNMDCPITDSDCDILSSTAMPIVQPPQLSPSSPQLRLYNGTPIPALPPFDFLNKGKASMPFDSSK